MPYWIRAYRKHNWHPLTERELLEAFRATPDIEAGKLLRYLNQYHTLRLGKDLYATTEGRNSIALYKRSEQAIKALERQRRRVTA